MIKDLWSSRKGQITIFIIIAAVIIAGVLIYFVVKSNFFPSNQYIKHQEVYDYFDDCVEKATVDGLTIAGIQAGYIDVPEFVPGSNFAPFSSQLDFLGNPVPYWYYVSANNIIKEQVPTKKQIETQLSEFVLREISGCDFSEFRKKGYSIKMSNFTIDSKILESNVDIVVSGEISVAKENLTSSKSEHEISVKSKFGKFYNLAKEVYEKEKKSAFLENYSLDVLWSYAPMTGVELSCNPKIWEAPEVVQDIKNGLSANIGNLKVEGDYYKKGLKYQDYFIIKDVNVDKGDLIRFMYDPEWTTRVEIWPAENSLMIAKPIGLEQGMGIIGFCYVPYHFTYDVYYPVLIQVTDNKELFQFPVAVIIDKSSSRQSLTADNLDETNQNIEKICDYKNTPLDVFTFDQKGNPVEADISYVCMNVLCDIGKTEIIGNDAQLSENFPQCINGKIVAQAEGFVTENYIVSTNEPTIVNIPMSKLYDLDVELVVGGRPYELGSSSDNAKIALISFEGEKQSAIISYPDQKNVKLSEGYYNVSVQIFGGSSLTIPSSTSRQCVKTTAPGILGFFGKQNEQCFDVTIPEQKLSGALTAGGKTGYYVLEEELKVSNKLKVSVTSFPTPSSIEQLQNNYDLYEKNNINLNFE
ncbi:MAG TPA: hypothetical protein P5277_04015 [Candidatus Paceibacterota bacterium]|nr:hypothetical protein [Candidatus Paceibacterota bacterium]